MLSFKLLNIILVFFFSLNNIIIMLIIENLSKLRLSKIKLNLGILSF